MFPIYRTSGFTYDTLSEIRPGRIRTGLAAMTVAGAVAVAVLAWGEQPVQADVPDEVAIYASIDDGAILDDVVRAEP